ncbi:beta-ketoacyl-[acyl-carrier-protein] synthase family protein [uncultured Planktosalinus sp.]|uniref:beta-ketoacyl-[acyl-carrier-protein] synthase family protein n=1 Tax=uncultured Planktosalinus sp. TaxID=1810935 RepID=UPI0030DA1230
MPNKVAITGMGIISSIGNNVEENFHALIHGATGISKTDYLKTIHKDTLKFGEIKLSNQELESKLGLPTNHRFPRTSLLGAYAAAQAVESAGIKIINEVPTGLISSTSVGGMDKTEEYFYEYFENEAIRRFILSHDAGETSHQIAEYLGIKGFVTTISTACSSAANAIMMGARLIKAGKLERVIVGGADALSIFTINGFNSLMILTDDVNTPFDDNRKGLNLGEAAAYIVLESESQVKNNNKKVLAYLSGYGNANDAFHQTASSENGEGATLAMKKAFEVSGLELTDIDYINAHGTATPNNDLSEGRAIQNVFGKNVPVFSSTKPFTGHTLAAAASVEAVYSILALKHDMVFPNKNFKTPMKEFDLIPQTSLLEKPVHHVLSNSFGFGGNCSTLIFSKSL